MNQGLRSQLRQVRLLVLDFDGVLTDGAVYVDTEGRESVRCSHRDGQGIQDVRTAGIEVIVISGQRSGYVDARCRKMGIRAFRGISDKVACLRAYLAETREQTRFSQVCFIGDDRGDIELLREVGVPCTVADGIDECKAVAHHITSAPGGHGAVREVCDLLLEAWKEVD